MSIVVQFGAGCIGRGFLGQLWAEAGYEVVFVDVNDELVNALNRRQAYPLCLVAYKEKRHITVRSIRAVHARDQAVIAKTLAACAFASTAVGVNVFGHLAPTLAAGVAARAEAGGASPLNIICGENQSKAGALLRATVANHIADDSVVRRFFAASVTFVDASVGRMVPPPTPELLAKDPLLLVAEPYKTLPIDADAWLGPIPFVPGLLPARNFAGPVARKLFTHNGGHACLAYLGFLCGHEYLYQAANDDKLVAHLRGFWDETGRALIAEYGFDADEQQRHENDLLRRFQNYALGDTVTRVARDPARKLRPDDRLVGAALLCLRHGIAPVHVAGVIAGALRYAAPGDEAATQVQAVVAAKGTAGALKTLCGLADDSPLIPLVEAAQVSRS